MAAQRITEDMSLGATQATPNARETAAVILSEDVNANANARETDLLLLSESVAQGANARVTDFVFLITSNFRCRATELGTGCFLLAVRPKA